MAYLTKPLLAVLLAIAAVSIGADERVPSSLVGPLGFLAASEQDAGISGWGVYVRQRNGALFLLPMQTTTQAVDGEIGTALNAGWWLDEFVSIDWGEESSEVRVQATFITGAGPMGARPFAAEVRLRRAGSGWVPDEPILLAED